jgi:hypothetical protein
MVQRIKTGMIADDAVTAAKLSTDAENISVFRNRIINGGMVIDQRNAGAAANNGVSVNTYVVDRFSMYGTEAAKISGQQSTTAPTGFVNSWLITSLAATTATSAQAYGVRHIIEGTNISDLGWGSASAKAVTISFWVRSSITGTYALALFNRDGPNRSYVANYTIDSANTFEYKTITIPGDTSGTWLTTNGQGIQVWWDLGSGSNLNETAENWVGSLKARTSGSANWVGTNGATFYITGVQFEKGTQATSFEYRQYTTELQLCLRYFYMLCNGNAQSIPTGSYYRADLIATTIQFPVEMRTSPTLFQVSGTNYFRIHRNDSSDDFNSFTDLVRASPRCVALDSTNDGASGIAGQSGPMNSNNTSARLGFSAEL